MRLAEFFDILDEIDLLVATREAPLVARIREIQESHGSAWEQVMRLATQDPP